MAIRLRQTGADAWAGPSRDLRQARTADGRCWITGESARTALEACSTTVPSVSASAIARPVPWDSRVESASPMRRSSERLPATRLPLSLFRARHFSTQEA